jgi:hypothetical protein
MVDNSPCRRCEVLGSHLEELRSLASKIQGMLSLACADRGTMVDNAKPCWLIAGRLFDAPDSGPSSTRSRLARVVQDRRFEISSF